MPLGVVVAILLHDGWAMYAIREPTPPALPFARHFAPIAATAHEIVVVVFLDRSNRVLGLRHCPSASLVRVDVPLRAIVADALALDACRVVMAHNHPSGDAEPSHDDIVATRRIAAALGALAIRLVDHFVLTRDGFTSFRTRGLL